MIRLGLCIIIILLVLIYSIFDAIICFIIKIFDKNIVRKYHHNFIRFIFKIFVFISNAKIEIKGIENLDDSKPLFIISNHRGFFDIIIGYTLLKSPCGFVAKDNFKNVFLLSYWMKKIDCLFLDRKDIRSGVTMIIDAVKKINSGVSIWLFPEGTRNKNINPLPLLEFKSGAFKIPEKADAYILPIAFLGNENIFEKHIPFIKPAMVKINIGKKFKIKELDKKNSVEIGEYSRNILTKLLEEIM